MWCVCVGLISWWAKKLSHPGYPIVKCISKQWCWLNLQNMVWQRTEYLPLSYNFPTGLPLFIEQQFAWQAKFDLSWDSFLLTVYTLWVLSIAHSTNTDFSSVAPSGPSLIENALPEWELITVLLHWPMVHLAEEIPLVRHKSPSYVLGVYCPLGSCRQGSDTINLVCLVTMLPGAVINHK